MSEYFSNLSPRKKSEQWVKQKADEFCKTGLDITFAEWCYRNGENDGIRKFAEWLTKSDYANGYFETENGFVSIDRVLAEYEKEKKNEN